jgi:hypothetical protein
MNAMFLPLSGTSGQESAAFNKGAIDKDAAPTTDAPAKVIDGLLSVGNIHGSW